MRTLQMSDTGTSIKLVAQPGEPAKRYADGVIAQYIHELSERHADDARNASAAGIRSRATPSG
jgi:hypothetical protein